MENAHEAVKTTLKESIFFKSNTPQQAGRYLTLTGNISVKKAISGGQTYEFRRIDKRYSR